MQALIKRKQPKAEYVHCAAHNLNLVLNDSVNEIEDITSFYDTIQSLYVFFSESLPRWQLLNSDIKNNQTVAYTLKKLCPTRWSSRYDSLLAIKNNYLSILKCLSNLSVTAKKTMDRCEANGLKNKIENLNFIFILQFQGSILENTNILSKSLQSSSIDMSTATDLLEKVLLNFNKLRDNFDTTISQSIEIAQKWGINSTFQDKRIKKVNKFFDELAADEPVTNPVKRLRVCVFNKCLDLLINQLNIRFDCFKNIYKCFDILHPNSIARFDSSELENKAMNLIEKYPDDLNPNLISELNQLKLLLGNKLTNIKTIKDFATFILIENDFLLSSLPNLSTALQLFLVLPVTSASAERSFSKLKLIKSFLRSAMTNERLNCLALISIENERASNLDLDELVAQFLNSKAC